jgi:uncharacterized protein (TIGR00725 family)
VSYVAVIGQGTVDPSAPLLETAAQLGTGLAAAGAVVVCGGLGGVMEAVSRGVHERGGCCVGLLPGRERAEGNPYLSIALPTGLGEARNVLVVRAGEVVIALGRGYGTLSEIALALRMRKPVIALATWEVADEDELMYPVADAGHAVQLALELCGRSSS